MIIETNTFRILKSGSVRLILAAVFVFTIGMFAEAQDLGSSNKLFGGKKAKQTKTTKKPVAQHKTTPGKKAAAKKAVGHRTAAARKPVAKKPAASAVHKPKPKPAGDERTPVKIAPPVAIGSKKREKTPVGPAKVKPDRPRAVDTRLFEKTLREAETAFADRDYSAAEAAYNRAVELDSQSARAHMSYAIMLIDLERWEDAERSLRTAVKIEPANYMPYIALSYVLSQPVSASDLADRYEEAEKFARKAVTLNGGSAAAHDQLGVVLELRGMIGEEPESEYRRAIRLSPSFAPAHAHLGRLLRQRGRSIESDAAFSDATAKATDAPALIRIAITMQSEQRFADSLPLLKTALSRDPRNLSALTLLGRGLTATGKYREAEDALNRSIDINPNGFVPHSLLGDLYLRQRMLEAAENELQRAARYAAGFEKRGLSNQFQSLGDAFYKAGNRESGERAHRKAAALDPKRMNASGKLIGSQDR